MRLNVSCSRISLRWPTFPKPGTHACKSYWGCPQTETSKTAACKMFIGQPGCSVTFLPTHWAHSQQPSCLLPFAKRYQLSARTSVREDLTNSTPGCGNMCGPVARWRLETTSY